MTENELIQVIQSLPPINPVPEPHTWLRHCYALRQHILTDDPDNFLQWSTIQATMATDPTFQNYHLDKWEEKTGLKISDLKSICEFGGGYGAMIKMVHERGFSGKYYSYDFPELVALQRFYLPDLNILTDIPSECDLLIAICSLSEVDLETRRSFLNKLDFSHCLIRYQHRFNGIDNHQFFESFDGERWLDSEDHNHWYLVK